MATYGKCVCGKSVSERKDGTPRAHICNAPNGPEWATMAQPVVPADVDETDSPTEELLAAIDDPFTTPTKDPADIVADRESAGGHVHHFQYVDVPNGGPCGSFCACGMEEPDRLSEPVSEVDIDAPEANWNGTGRPRPSASTVKLPPAEPVKETPRLLDTLAAASAGAGTVLDRMTPEQQSAAVGAQQMADAFTTPTPQGSGPRRGAAPATHTGVPSAHSLGLSPQEQQDARVFTDVIGRAADAFSAPTRYSATVRGPVSEDVAQVITGQTDPFSTPTHVAPALGSATDQPETERDRYGRYLIKDPRTGDFKRNRRGTPEGFTRATTYGKALLDQFGIHQWEMRSVLAGLALRPDLVRAAQGLDVTQDKDRLNEIAASAKEAAGGNEAANDGTEFHTVTEWIDTGRMEPKDAPEKFRAEALAYAGKMAEAGLATRFGWIERVTFTDRGGEDVAGTADRVLVERNGQHVVGDVKSGKGIDLAQREIAIQLKVYAMGINQFGLYNKATQQWEPWTGPPVSEEYGIVMHVPVVRPEGTEAYCDLYRVDLRGVAPFEVSSAMHAAAWTREWRKQKGFVSPYHAPAVQAALPADASPRRTWKEAFTTVTTPGEANRLWQAAVDAGMERGDLDHYVSLARLRLERLAGTRVS